MGLFSNIGNAVKGFLTSNPVGKTITKTLDTLSGIVTNPVTAITKGTAASTAAFQNASPITNTVKTITNTALAGAAVATAGSALGLTVPGTLGSSVAGGTAAAAKALIPTTTKGKVIGGTVAVLGAGVAIAQPAKTAEAVLSAPAAVANLGGNVANFISDPSLSSAKKIYTDNPIAATIATGAAVLGAGVGIGTAASLVSNYQNTKAVKENTAATLGAGTDIAGPQLIKLVDKSNEFKTQPINTAVQTPVTPQTQTLSSTSKSSKKRKKRTSKAVMPNISQRVNVVVANRNISTGIRQNKKYIKRAILTYA